MAERISIVAMDLDGTLLGLDKKISSENARALKDCRKRGVHVVLASGRSFESVRTFANAIGIDCAVISCNGARMDASVHGPLMMEDCIPEAQAIELFDALMGENVYFECYTPGRIYMTDGFVERFHSHEARVMELDGYKLEYIDGTERMRNEAMSCAYKFVVFSPDTNRLSQVAEKMKHFDIMIATAQQVDLVILKSSNESASYF